MEVDGAVFLVEFWGGVVRNGSAYYSVHATQTGELDPTGWLLRIRVRRIGAGIGYKESSTGVFEPSVYGQSFTPR